MTKHLSPESIAWLRERIAYRNAQERSAIKSVAHEGFIGRRDLIDFLVEFGGADREQLRQLRKEDLA